MPRRPGIRLTVDLRACRTILSSGPEPPLERVYSKEDSCLHPNGTSDHHHIKPNPPSKRTMFIFNEEPISLPMRLCLHEIGVACSLLHVSAATGSLCLLE